MKTAVLSAVRRSRKRIACGAKSINSMKMNVFSVVQNCVRVITNLREKMRKII